MRGLSTWLAVAALSVVPAVPQQPLTEKIDVNLVNVDVTVTSRGEPARGLTRDDFEVREDGVPQPITNFFAVERGREAAAAESPSAPSAPDERFRRKVLVIVDNVSTTIHNRHVALAQLERFINEHFSSGEYDWAIAIASQRFHLALPPTSDKAAIHAALEDIRRTGTTDLIRSGVFEPRPGRLAADDRASLLTRDGANPFRGEADMRQLMTANSSVRTIAEAARAFATVEGKKIILILTADLGLSPVRAFESFEAPSWFSPELDEMARGITGARDAMIAEANASNVSLYILNTEGMDADSMSMYWLARETGGRVMPGNDPALSLRDFDRASANYYSLAYRPPHGEDGSYHHITVRLKKRGRYGLQYRDGYFSASSEAQLDRALRSAAAVAIMPSKFAVEVTTGEPVSSGNGVVVPVRAAVAAKDLQFIPGGQASTARVDVILSLFDMEGRNIDIHQYTQDATVSPGAEQRGEVAGTHLLRLRKGTPYRLVVAVRDHLTDAVGIHQHLVRF